MSMLVVRFFWDGWASTSENEATISLQELSKIYHYGPYRFLPIVSCRATPCIRTLWNITQKYAIKMTIIIMLSYHMITPSHEIMARNARFIEKMTQSRRMGQCSSLMGCRKKICQKKITEYATHSLTEDVANPATAATPKVLNSIEPIMVPRPMFESAMKVLMVLVKNSGVVVARLINVAAATFYGSKKNYKDRSKSNKEKVTYRRNAQVITNTFY
jgi:hypothetical protein